MFDTIKSVLVVFTEEGRGETSAAVPYAMSLAQQAGAHLTLQAASVRYAVPSSLINNFAAEIVGKENRRMAELAQKLADDARFTADLAGVTCTVEAPQLLYPGLTQRFIAYARVHDLAVLDAERETLEIDRGLIEAAIFETGRPALIVPPGRLGFSAKRVLVAWDGGAASARAVADAMTFLIAADEVEILSVTGEKDLSDRIPGSELAPHLARHGARTTVKNIPMPSAGVADAIKREADAFGADLIVSGAFKHSRLREWLLGGVTQSLLKDCAVPVLMSH